MIKLIVVFRYRIMTSCSKGGAFLVKLVARSITDHYYLSSNLGVGISEGCFISEFASLPKSIISSLYRKVAVKHQSSSSSSSSSCSNRTLLCQTLSERYDNVLSTWFPPADLRGVAFWPFLCSWTPGNIPAFGMVNFALGWLENQIRSPPGRYLCGVVYSLNSNGQLTR